MHDINLRVAATFYTDFILTDFVLIHDIARPPVDDIMDQFLDKFEIIWACILLTQIFLSVYIVNQLIIS